MQEEEPIIYALCTAVVAVLVIVARRFISGSGPMCTVLCLKAQASDVAIDTQPVHEG